MRWPASGRPQACSGGWREGSQEWQSHLFLSHGLAHALLLHHEGLLQLQVLLMLPLGLLLPGFPLLLLLWTQSGQESGIWAQAPTPSLFWPLLPRGHQVIQLSPFLGTELLQDPDPSGSHVEQKAEAPLLTVP